MLLLLLFIKGSPNDKLTSMNLWIFASGNETEPAEDEISPEDVWIFSVSDYGFYSLAYTVLVRCPLCLLTL